MNSKIEAALKKVKETQWVGGANVQPTLEHALCSMNFSSQNGGMYQPTAKKIDGVKGYFLVNKDGSIHYEVRAIKQESGSFLIEYLSNDGFKLIEAAMSEKKSIKPFSEVCGCFVYDKGVYESASAAHGVGALYPIGTQLSTPDQASGVDDALSVALDTIKAIGMTSYIPVYIVGNYEFGADLFYQINRWSDLHPDTLKDLELNLASK